MQNALILLVVFSGWITFGYLFWRAVYYGSIKFFHLKYGDTQYKNNKASISWIKARPMVVCCGIGNLIVIAFFPVMRKVAFTYGITLYYNMHETK